VSRRQGGDWSRSLRNILQSRIQKRLGSHFGGHGNCREYFQGHTIISANAQTYLAGESAGRIILVAHTSSVR